MTTPRFIPSLVTITQTTPFTWHLGLARSLLALSTLLTQLFTPVGALFLRTDANPLGPTCDGFVRRATFYCLGGSAEWVDAAVVMSIVALAVVASGVLPRFTAIPHWYLSWSAATGFGLVDGGDHINAMLTAILVPIVLCDRRRTHWQQDRDYDRRSIVPKAVAHVGLLVAAIQMAVLYLIASLSKVNVAEWADGTALWYWLSDPSFGMDAGVFSFFAPVLSNIAVLAALTYTMMALEITGALALVFPRRARHVVFVLLIAFHTVIAIVMGLWTFGLSMAAGLLLYLVRPGERLDFSWVRPRRRPAAIGGDTPLLVQRD